LDRPATRGDAVEVEVLGTVDGASPRRALVRRALAGAAVLGSAAFLGRRLEPADAAPSASQDAKIFNFALLLEYLQAAFYTRAVDGGALRGELRDFAETVSEHERDHVAFLRNALGSKARQRPEFDFGGATRDERQFAKTALLLENIGVAAYNGQAANLTKKALAAAVEIVSVEGRHAAWISDITGQDPAPRAADPGESAAEVAAALRATGFLKST
jgi:Ferritin-like domain